MSLRFRFSIYADINVGDKNFDWESIEDVREVATLIAEETVENIGETCDTGAYNFYLGGVAFFPFGEIPDQKEVDRL